MGNGDQSSQTQLGQVMVQIGLLTNEELASALDEQDRSKRPLGLVVVELGFASAPAVAKALAIQRGNAAFRDVDRRSRRRDHNAWGNRLPKLRLASADANANDDTRFADVALREVLPEPETHQRQAEAGPLQVHLDEGGAAVAGQVERLGEEVKRLRAEQSALAEERVRIASKLRRLVGELEAAVIAAGAMRVFELDWRAAEGQQMRSDRRALEQ